MLSLGHVLLDSHSMRRMSVLVTPTRMLASPDVTLSDSMHTLHMDSGLVTSAMAAMHPNWLLGFVQWGFATTMALTLATFLFLAQQTSQYWMRLCVA